ncbi:serine/threonine protein kinase [Streptomyces sp. NBC_00457]|uniref:serine/threonine-protein kinase n=1 Tax=Streptomyces sp. NBC_00457 TaxID=2975748 RepID=UPI002E1CD087
MARKIGSRYTAHQILGRGSAGTVWLGEGPEGPVAIKLLREDLASDQELVGRFVQERTALLGLEHPNVVSVRDLVVDGNDLALVMDLVRGTDLRTRLDRDRRLAPEAAVAIVADVADGLAAAHAAGVVHRDVKPENVLLDMQGPLGPGSSHRALLTDFGVAKLIDSPRRTRATKIIGTPDYLAPEIVEGLPPRASVDIYALATVLYELLAGFTPFGGGHPGAVLRRHVTETVVPLPGIPDELWQLLVQCLAKAPASRLRASEMGARLRELLPLMAGMPPLDVDEPDADAQAAEEAEEAVGTGASAAERGERVRRRGAVPLVPGAKPADSNRDTHTSMRVPGPDELAGGARGTARVPRAAGAPRPGSARHRAVTRRRRVAVGVAAVVLVVAAGVGAWLATSGDDADATPQDTNNSAPATP